jgi:hypothetical protein
MRALLSINAAEDHTRVDTAEAERIAHDVVEFRFAAVVRDDVQIARKIDMFVVDRRRDPLSI